LGLATVSALGRLPAFLVPLLIATAFGAGVATDAYFIAYGAALFLGGTLAQGLEYAIVPFVGREVRRSGGAPRIYLDSAARGAALIAVGVCVFGTPLLGLLVTSNLRLGVVRYSACFALFVVAWCGAAVFGGAHVSQWRIATATGSMLWRGGGALLGFAVAPLGGGLAAVAFGLGAGEILRLFWLRSKLFSALPISDGVAAPHLSPLGRAAAAQVAASAAIGVVPVVERLLAISVGIGAVSHLEYAMRLLVVPGVLFEGALAPLLLARWSHEITTEGRVPPRRDVLRIVRNGLALAVVFGVLLALFARPMVAVLLHRGRFTGEDAEAVAVLLRILALGFVATMGALLTERLYLAATRNRLLAQLSVARAVIRVVTAVALLKSRGLIAFAIGYTVADWCYLAALVTLVRPVPTTDPVRASN
jgi:putative peptidoglycan lipid II flippase